VSALEVVAAGPRTTVQDLGRPGYAHLGVPTSGAADRAALRLANRLVGNPEDAAALEATLGGLVLAARGPVTLAAAGAPCPPAAGARALPAGAVVELADGERAGLGVPTAGLRTYVAVRGGVEVEPVLGSRATDSLSGLGPEPLRAGDLLALGPPPAATPLLDVAPVPVPPAGQVTLRVLLGPRDDWFSAEAVRRLLTSGYTVDARSDRVGLRLLGPALARVRTGELASEGMVPGCLQVPSDAGLVLLLADAPVTGGYPVVAVVVDADLDRSGQLRPGQPLRFSLA
jgi:biotin-dependent carboxylase-like uncharacterized protein